VHLSGRHVVAAVLVVLAVVWVLVNGPVEGRVLWIITPTHGLTVADLASLAAVLVAVVLVWPRRG
jgi:hypothetical protein